MLKKEDIGHGLEKAARILPGIGSYQDRESSREADKALRMKLSGRLNQLLDQVEGLKSGLAKKGAIRNILPLEDLSRHLEKVSRVMEFASRGYSPLFSRKHIDEEALDRIYKCDRGLLGLLIEMEEAVQVLGGKSEPEWKAGIEPIREMLSRMETSLKERETFQ
ncbi:MAG: hypothetical protein WAL98_13410 [Desulfatiglandaceae bacterium]|jgi:hypothetical protein